MTAKFVKNIVTFTLCSLMSGGLLWGAPRTSAYADNVTVPITLEQTRVIFEKETRRAHLSLKNESRLPVMMSATVFHPSEDLGEGEQSKFMIVTPPSKVLQPGRTETLRLVLLGEDLPEDRESLLYLRLKFLPAQRENERADNVSSMLTLYAKVFVRPASLAIRNANEKSCGQLIAEQKDRRIRLSNPGPYWVTLPFVTLDGKDLPREERALSLEPFGQLIFPHTGTKLEFSCVLEGGRYSDIQTRVLH